MRRQGNFSDSPASGYGAGQIQNAHSDFQGQLEAFTPERDHSIHYNKSPLLIERLIPENQLEYQKSNHNTFLRYTIYSKKANTFSIFHNINPN